MTTQKFQQGTTITWKNTGADEDMTLTSLTNGTAREGTKTDLGATFGLKYGWKLTWDHASGPTAGQLVRVFLGWSEDDTDFTGDLSGTDGDLSDAVDVVRQLTELQPAVVNNVTVQQYAGGTFAPVARYLAPVIYNVSGQDFDSTAGNFEFVIWPIEGIAV